MLYFAREQAGQRVKSDTRSVKTRTTSRLSKRRTLANDRRGYTKNLHTNAQSGRPRFHSVANLTFADKSMWALIV